MKRSGNPFSRIRDFILGLTMMVGGFYILLNSIQVNSYISISRHLYRVSSLGGFSITSGMVMISLIFGIGLMFYNRKSITGWLLTFGSIIMLIFGVVSSIRFSFIRMSVFDLIVIFVLCAGGVGVFFRSFKAQD